MTEDNYFVYDIHKYGSKIRAIIWHVKKDSDTGKTEFKSEYSVGVNLENWESYCTCVGWNMNKKCSHLKALFNDRKYKELCKNGCKEQNNIV